MLSDPNASASSSPILFFDGECGLCAKSVQWFLRHDHRGVLRYAPLQGQTYAALDAPRKPAGMKSLVLADAEGLHVRSEATLRALRAIDVRGIWRIAAAIARIIPRPLRDLGYRFISRTRRLWFKPADACALASESQRRRFLP